MKWMKYAAYLGYLSYVYKIVAAIADYRIHREPRVLATVVSEAVYDAVDYATKGAASQRVARESVRSAVKGVTDLYIDVID